MRKNVCTIYELILRHFWLCSQINEVFQAMYLFSETSTATNVSAYLQLLTTLPVL